jgi:hypothetical protein
MKVGTGNFFIAPMEAASSSPPPPPAHDHRNDERTGQRIMWLLFATVGLCQVAVVQWRTRHPKSFNLALLACLWLFPVGLLIMQGWGALFRAPFFYVWLLFSLLMGALLGAVRQRTLAEATPGIVYGVLEWLYLQCMGASGLVLTCFMALFLMPALAAALPPWALSGVLLVGAYSVYFAVLLRDVTVVISDALVARLSAGGGGGGGDGAAAGAGSRAGRDTCGLCAGVLHIVDEGTAVEDGGDGGGAPGGARRPIAVRRADGTIVFVGGDGAGAKPPPPQQQQQQRSPAGAAGAAAAPKTLRFASRDGKTIMFQLTCKHIFHRTCLAGWCVVGKKGVCPCCSERVEMGAVYSQDSPLLGKTSALFGQALDVCRYLVVFNPIIWATLRVFLVLTGTMRDIEEHTKAGGGSHGAHAGHGH